MKQLVIVGVILLSFAGYAEEKVEIGGRLQGILANDSETETQDMYLRRMRVNVTYKPWEGHVINYDVRNDKSNTEDKGEGTFNIGDAYWQIAINKYSVKNIRMFRAKVDVSYTQTASSKNLFSPNRADVSEYASDYVVSNRRANNIQANGNVGNMAYQVAISDGVDSAEMDTLEGSTVTVEGIEGQKLTYGGKVRYYFFGDVEKNTLKETYYGNHDTFSIGLGHFRNDKIIFELSDSTTLTSARSLTNLELSYSLGGFRLLGEYFSFENDIVDLDATNRDDKLDTSVGSYVLVEYVFKNKWAPNVGYETFDQSHDDVDYVTNGTTVGLNYYNDQQNLRFGIFYKKIEVKETNQKSDNELLQLYAMLDF